MRVSSIVGLKDWVVVLHRYYVRWDMPWRATERCILVKARTKSEARARAKARIPSGRLPKRTYAYQEMDF